MVDIFGKIKRKSRLFLKKVKKFWEAIKRKIKKRKLTRKQIIFIGFFIFFLLAAGDWFIKSGGFNIFKNLRFKRDGKFASRIFTIHKDHSPLLPAKLEELVLGPTIKIRERQETFRDRLLGKSKVNHFAGPQDNLQEIINSITDYGVIYLSKGTYSINLFINKKLRLVGEGKETVLKAANEKNAIIKVRDGGLGLEDVVLADSSVGLDARNSELFVSDARFRNISATAFYTKESSVELKNSSIVNSGEAIKALRSNGSIRNSIIADSLKSGIRLIKSDFIIEYNKITGNRSYGIYVDEESEAQIRYNYIKDNEGYNVRIQKTRDIYK